MSRETSGLFLCTLTCRQSRSLGSAGLGVGARSPGGTGRGRPGGGGRHPAGGRHSAAADASDTASGPLPRRHGAHGTRRPAQTEEQEAEEEAASSQDGPGPGSPRDGTAAAPRRSGALHPPGFVWTKHESRHRRVGLASHGMQSHVSSSWIFKPAEMDGMEIFVFAPSACFELHPKGRGCRARCDVHTTSSAEGCFFVDAGSFAKEPKQNVVLVHLFHKLEKCFKFELL